MSPQRSAWRALFHSRRQQCGRRIGVCAPLRLRPPLMAWPSPQKPPAVHRLSRSHAPSNRQLFSSASGLGCDRRDADHGRARGDRAIHQDAAGRACLSAGADPEAARPRAGRDRGSARHRALHAAGGRPGEAARGSLPRAQRALPVDPRSGAGAAAVLSRRRDQPPGRRAAHAQCRIFQAHRRAQLHHAARRRTAHRGSRRGRRRAGRRLAHVEDADLDLSRQPRREDRQRAAGAGHSGCAVGRSA